MHHYNHYKFDYIILYVENLFDLLLFDFFLSSSKQKNVFTDQELLNSTFHNVVSPDGICFHEARAVTLFVMPSTIDRNRICLSVGYLLTPMFKMGNDKRPFQCGTMCSRDALSKVPKTHYSRFEHRMPSASRMSVSYHLAAWFQALVILMQKTHCTSAERLVLDNYHLVEFFFSRKHGMAFDVSD